MNLNPAHSPKTPAPPPPLRGPSMVLTAGLAVVGVGLLAIAGAGGWAVIHAQQQAVAAVRESVETSGHVLAKSIEPRLALEDRAGVLSLLTTATSESGFRRCRVVQGDGKLYADAVPPKMSARHGRDEMTLAEAIPEAERNDANIFNTIVALAGPGEARLELSHTVTYPKWTGIDVLGGLAGGGVLGAGLLVGALARLQKRLRGAAAIGDALMALKRGENSPAALSVSNKFGAEAGVWNQLLAERETMRKQASGEKARDALGARGDMKADLAYACDALWQGMVMVDERLSIQYANGAAAIFLQTKRDAMVGAAIDEFIKDPALLESIRSVAAGTVRHRTTIELKRPEGEGGGVLRFNIRPVRKDDTSASVVVMIEDITQQRVADAARNSFVAQATHELRTPLTNIRLYVEQAIEVGDGNPAVRTKCLDVINHECSRLERIVGDMLSVSEIEAGSFKLRSGDVRLDSVFKELRSDFAPNAAEKNIELKFNLPPKLPAIKGDRDKIVLAIHNLVGNAIKYTPKGGMVAVRVMVDGGQLTVEVVDNGIGISAEETELIFEKFYRAKDKRVSEITGTGLGLSLAREVVRLHGGDIVVRSELNKGSTFTLTVPTLTEAA